MLIFKNLLLPMDRDIVCVCRLIVDSLPSKIRNSKLLFRLLATILKENKFIFEFRDFYEKNPDFDLTLLYDPNSRYFSNSFSNKTDCNSRHQDFLARYLVKVKPYSLLDVGCGSGFLLHQLQKRVCISKAIGVDINTSDKNSSTSESNQITLINSEILEYLLKIPDGYFDITLCTHVLEHLKDPGILISEMRRVSSRASIFVAPLEKKFAWGLNYHVNFYETPQQFLNIFLMPTKRIVHTDVCVELGDILYVEQYIE